MPSYSVLPLGIGLTEKPAAEVKGVATPKKDDVGIVIPESFDDEGSKDTPKQKSVPTPDPGQSNKVGITIPPASETMKKRIESHGGNINEQKDRISHSVKTDVRKERNVTMKINSIKDITDENLKECTASVVSEFIAAELKKGSDEWEKNKNALNTQLTEAKATGEKLQSEQTKLQDELKKVQATVESLSAEKFKGIAKTTTKTKESKDGDGDTKIKVKVKVKADDEDDMTAKKKAKVSQEAQAAIEQAADNGTTEKGGLPNGTSAAAPSLKEKYKNSFAMENIVIKV